MTPARFSRLGPDWLRSLDAVAVFIIMCALLETTLSTDSAQWVVSTLSSVVTGIAALLVGPTVHMACRLADRKGAGEIEWGGRPWMVAASVISASAAAVGSFGPRELVPFLCVVIVVSAWCAVTDTVTKRLPTIWMWTGAAAAALSLAFLDFHRIGWAIMWGLICGGVFVILTVITAGTPGLGDARLAVILGGAAGGAGGAEFVWGWIFCALIIAALWALYEVIVRRKSRKATMAFAPALFVGFLGAIFLG